MSVEYTKIALSGSGDDTKVHLHYTEPTNSGGQQEHDLTSKDVPMDTFAKAMYDLNQYVEELMDFPTHYANGCAVHIVSLSGTPEKRSVILSVKKILSNGLAFNFNTPKYAEPDPESPDRKTAMPEPMRKQLSVLIAEANKYRKGERSQLGMFSQGNGKAEEGDQDEGDQSDG